MIRPNDKVVRKDGKPGEWTVGEVSPGGFAWFKGYSGPFLADDYKKKGT